jgi:hypothetical protein
MPMQSENQRRAMHAAASGKSTLGIPKKVAKEFVDADEGGKLPKKAGQYALPKSNRMMPPKKVDAVLDAQSDAAVGLPSKAKFKGV